MKTPLLSLAASLAAAPAVFAWPFVSQNPNPGAMPNYAAQNHGRLLQLDNDPAPEYYRGGMDYTQFTVNGAGTATPTRVALPPPNVFPGDYNNFYSLGRGDAGDIDGDGDLDIVYSCQAAFGAPVQEEDFQQFIRIVVCRNDGNGNFSNIWQTKEGAVLSNGVPDIKLADMDRDGDLDLVESYSGVRIRWNPGTGVFNGSTTVRSAVAAYSPAVEVADYDSNGWLDVAVLVDAPGNARLELFSQNDGTFTGSTVFTHPSDSHFDEVTSADLDGDGRMDILASVYSSTGSKWTGYLSCYRNTGSGLAAPQDIWSGPAPDGLELFQTADVDEDGITDVVYAVSGSELHWRRGTGDGFLAPDAVLFTLPSLNLKWSDLALGDIDTDGKTDIILANNIYRNTARPNVPSAAVTQWAGTTLSGTVDLTTGDLNNDGRADLIALDGGAKFIRWYTSGPDGLTTQLPFSLFSAVSPHHVAAGDWNGDGWTDLAWAGDGQFRHAVSGTAFGSSWITAPAVSVAGIGEILAADMDRDGDTDILACDNSSLRILSNNGSASWTSQTVATGFSGASRIAAGQLIPGGRMEAALLSVASPNAPKVTTFRHNGSWSQIESESGGLDSASKGLLMADISGSSTGCETIFSIGTNAVHYSWYAPQPVTPAMLGTTALPVVQLAATDWDKNGRTDVLVATTHGIALYAVQPGDGVNIIPLFSANDTVTIQDLVVLDINADTFPDAVAADTNGELHIITNTSAPLAVTTDSTGATGLPPGASGEVARLSVSLASTYGRAAAPYAPASVTVRFRRSVISGGTESPGTALTPSEVQALVENICLENGTRRSTPVVPAVAADGTFTMTLDNTSRQTLALISPLGLRVRLKYTATSAAVQRFYVELYPTHRWVSLNESGVSSPAFLRTSGDTDIARGLIYVRPLGPLDTWRMGNFGTYDITGTTANHADPDGDGVPNLVEYVIARNPNSAHGLAEGTPAVEVTAGGQSSSVQTILRIINNCDSRVKLTLQYSSSTQGWSTLSTRTGSSSNPWSGNIPSYSGLGGDRTKFTFDTGLNPQFTKKQFFRLKVEELP